MATGAALTALYNVGPGDCYVYPAQDEALNDQAADLPLDLPMGETMLAVPSGSHWLVVVPRRPAAVCPRRRSPAPSTAARTRLGCQQPLAVNALLVGPGGAPIAAAPSLVYQPGTREPLLVGPDGTAGPPGIAFLEDPGAPAPSWRAGISLDVASGSRRWPPGSGCGSTRAPTTGSTAPSASPGR